MDEEQLGVNRSLAIVGYQALCGAIVAGAMHFLPGNFNSLVHPVVGGLCIGASQAATLVLTGRTLGGWFCLYSRLRKCTDIGRCSIVGLRTSRTPARLDPRRQGGRLSPTRDPINGVRGWILARKLRLQSYNCPTNGSTGSCRCSASSFRRWYHGLWSETCWRLYIRTWDLWNVSIVKGKLYHRCMYVWGWDYCGLPW
jgi:hypothetical protein